MHIFGKLVNIVGKLVHIFAGKLVREVPDTFKFVRHVMRAMLSVRPKCSHRCVSLKETPSKPVLILAHAMPKLSTEQTSTRTKWFKHIAYAPWGPILWPFLRSSARAPTINAVRGTVAIKGVLDN